MLSEVVLVALNLDVQLLHSDLFFWLGLFLLLFSFGLLGLIVCWLNLHLGDLLDVLALFDLVIHLFKLLLVLLFLVILICLLVVLHLSLVILLCWVLFALTQVQILQLTQNTNIFKLVQIANDLWMPKLRSIIGFKISKLF